MTDPARIELERLTTERRIKFSALSRLLGRNPAYIQQFLKRGSPRQLEARDYLASQRRLWGDFLAFDPAPADPR